MADIIDDALALFTEQFREAPVLTDLATALMSPFLVVNQTLEDLFLLRWIDAAFGQQLDNLGDQVGELRKGRDDDDYRNAIRFRIFINVSKTEPATIIEATRVLSKGDFIRYWENYPAGFQIFTNGPNVIDISGKVLQIFDLRLEDGGPLELDDGGLFKSRTGYERPEGLADFLHTIAPAGIDPIAVSFSLGILPMFGFAGDFITASLVTNDGGSFHLDDGGTLDAYTDEVVPSPDGFIGYSEMQMQYLITDDTGDFYMSSNVVDPIICPLLTTALGAIGSDQLLINTETIVDVATYLTLDDGSVLITDDEGEFEIFGPGVVIEEDYIVLENGDEFGLIDYLAIPDEGVLLLDDEGEFELKIFNVLDDPGPLLVFDQAQTPVGGGKIIEGVVDGR